MAANRLRLFASGLAASGILSCWAPDRGVLPVGPDNPAEGIVIYSRIGYSGESAQLVKSVYNLFDYAGPCGTGKYGSTSSWTDCIQSIRVAPGWQTTLYSEAHYGGKSLHLTVDSLDLRQYPGPCQLNWSMCVSSIFVARQ